MIIESAQLILLPISSSYSSIGFRSGWVKTNCACSAALMLSFRIAFFGVLSVTDSFMIAFIEVGEKNLSY